MPTMSFYYKCTEYLWLIKDIHGRGDARCDLCIKLNNEIWMPSSKLSEQKKSKCAQTDNAPARHANHKRTTARNHS